MWNIMINITQRKWNIKSIITVIKFALAQWNQIYADGNVGIYYA